MINLDEKDHKLIALLRVNARTSVMDLSKALGVSRATVQNRMNRLKQNGVILKYTIELKADAEQQPIKAFMSIAIKGRLSQSVTRILQGFPDITSLHNTNGRWDIIAEIRTSSLESFNYLLDDVRLIDGVNSTETSLLLNTII